MSQPLVSVIVPAYNQAGYLRSCLDSLWFQDSLDLEIIVVNDGATDGTSQVVAAFERDLESLRTSFASRYDEDRDRIERTLHPVYPAAGRRFRVIGHARNQGLAAALNTGLTACRGTYCAYVPCDNLAYPHMVFALAGARADMRGPSGPP